MVIEAKDQDIDVKQLRSFGLIVGSVFALIALWPLVFHSANVRMWAIMVSGALAISALVVPTILKPIYRVWMKIGGILGWINTRIILSIGFFLVFMPVGMVMRILGKDPMRRKLDPNIETYRINPFPRSDSHMKNQY